jgi:hypothetical protein
MIQNWFATTVLLCWPIVTVYLYRTRAAGHATLLTILGGQLLLPVGALIKFDMIPQFDKNSIPNLTALACVLMSGRSLKFWYGFGWAELLLLMLLAGPFITSELNTDTLFIGGVLLPGASQYDATSSVVAQFIFWIPFFLGRSLLRSTSDSEAMLRVLTVSGLLYSLPMLLEIRVSPQLHQWLYGYFPNAFDQQIREGGYRPVVFLGHGLVVAFFIMTSAVASAALWRTKTRIVPFAPAGITAYLSAVLVLCKTMGADIYGAILVPLVRLARPRSQILVASVLAAIAISYPMLRTTDVIPTGAMIEIAKSVSDDRANSLKVRLDQEKMLLEHDSERLFFGWGRWGRSLLYDQGRDVSITDGRWIITIGAYGLFGFLAEFGLLTLPVFRAASALKFARSTDEKVYLAALALVVAISEVDLLPNGFFSPWTCLLAGGLLGRAEALVAGERSANYFKASNARPETMSEGSSRSERDKSRGDWGENRL